MRDGQKWGPTSLSGCWCGCETRCLLISESRYATRIDRCNRRIIWDTNALRLGRRGRPAWIPVHISSLLVLFPLDLVCACPPDSAERPLTTKFAPADPYFATGHSAGITIPTYRRTRNSDAAAASPHGAPPSVTLAGSRHAAPGPDQSELQYGTSLRIAQPAAGSVILQTTLVLYPAFHPGKAAPVLLFETGWLRLAR